MHSGAFPEKKHIVKIEEKELDTFLNNLKKNNYSFFKIYLNH